MAVEKSFLLITGPCLASERNLPDLFGHESKLCTLIPNDWSYKWFKMIFRGVQR